MSSWGYDQEDGPDTWVKDYPLSGGSSQSPVDIEPDEAVYDANLKTRPLVISYQPERALEIENTGHTFKANIKEKSVISGGPLEQKYLLEQFHLHWGSRDDKGSEHTICHVAFASELHLVHWNFSLYKDFSDAVSKDNGLAVFAVMIKVGKEHASFRELIHNMLDVKFKGQHYKLTESFDPASLLPVNTGEYWTYHGSLTTPPCCESVTWIVFKEPIEISHSQIENLRSLMCDEDGAGVHSMVDNYRPVLPLGRRKLRASFRNS